jgi:asparagine synthase (glutamine-hydrolysing)
MCGIAGILNYNHIPVQQSELVSLTDRLEHRGRDSAGIIIGGQQNTFYEGIGLGHRRLSIIDLRPSSAQPMLSTDGQFWITYNGELYNYIEIKNKLKSSGVSFRTESDTEVVLAAYQYWGKSCLSRFNGMFAFAIWDQGRKELFCARDAIGIKPFYYSVSESSFQFASESRALTKTSYNKLNTDAVHAYIFSMYQPGDLSLFEGIKKLLPGTYLVVDSTGKIQEEKYWTSQIQRGNDFESVGSIEERIFNLLEKAVERQLISDVPVGALLSGGFDSGLLVAIASGKIDKLHTYSVGFDDGLQQDELVIAKSMAARYNTIHHERIIRSDEVIDLLDKALICLSEPVADSAIVPTYCLSEMASVDGVKVLLSGTGGDEIFGGYSRYIGYSKPRQYFLAIPLMIRKLLGSTLLNNKVLGMRMKSPSLDMMMCAGGAPELFMQLFKSNHDALNTLDHISNRMESGNTKNLPLLYQHMLADIKVYLPDLLLMLLDQLTMAHTIEGRVPYLDVDLLQACLSLPPKVHINKGQTRQLQRQLAKGLIDERTFIAKKQGFSGPVSFWIDSNKMIFTDRIMAAREIPGLELLDIERLVSSAPTSGLNFWHNDMFALYCLSTWYHGNK